jgi:gas vesicle protein
MIEMQVFYSRKIITSMARRMRGFLSQQVFVLCPSEENIKMRGEINMAEHEKSRGYLFTGLLIGSVLGALAGILFAPKSGKELRSDIQEKGSEVFRDGKEIYSDTKKRARKIIKEAKHQAKELKKEADRHVYDARDKVKELFARG